MLHYQFLCDIEQTLNFLDVRGLVEVHVRQMIRPKMNGCFHWLRDKDMNILHINTFVFNAPIENVG